MGLRPHGLPLLSFGASVQLLLLSVADPRHYRCRFDWLPAAKNTLVLEAAPEARVIRLKQFGLPDNTVDAVKTER